MNYKIASPFIIIYTINIALSSTMNSDPIKLYLFKFNESTTFKFDLNFENMYMLESHDALDQKFHLMRCLSRTSKNNSNKVISFEVNNDSTISCKSYSPLNLLSTDILVPAPANSMIYLRHEIKINYHDCKYFYSFIYETKPKSFILNKKIKHI
jgi:hypothetical protein